MSIRSTLQMADQMDMAFLTANQSQTLSNEEGSTMDVLDMTDSCGGEIVAIQSGNGRVHGTIGPRGITISPAPTWSEEIHRNPDMAISNRIGQAKRLRKNAEKAGNPKLKNRLLLEALHLERDAEKIRKYAENRRF